MRFLLQEFVQPTEERNAEERLMKNSGLASAVSPDVDNRHPGGPANNRQVGRPKTRKCSSVGKPSGCRS